MKELNETVLAEPEEQCEPLQDLSRTEESSLPVLETIWQKRTLLSRLALWAAVLSTAIAFLLPRQYESTVRIMPPDSSQGGSAAMLAALTGKVPATMGYLAGNLLGMKNTGALFTELLHSRTVQESMVDRFGLQKLYRCSYKEDARKKLESRTSVSEDRKSGVIIITVTDNDRKRAQEMANAYVQELDKLVAQVSTSSARRQRVFIESRLSKVQQDLQNAEAALSEFSSKNMTLDVKEQTKAMVTAGADLQAQLISAQSELQGLLQAYGDENVRVRGARARIAELQRQIGKFSGSGTASADSNATELYPPLKKLPSLGVQWADLYRTTKVQETVFELLTQQYELAKIEEAKEIPSVQIIDPANFPERKSWPPRLLILIFGTLVGLTAAIAWVLVAQAFQQMSDEDPRKVLAQKWLQRSLENRRLRWLANR